MSEKKGLSPSLKGLEGASTLQESPEESQYGDADVFGREEDHEVCAKYPTVSADNIHVFPSFLEQTSPFHFRASFY